MNSFDRLERMVGKLESKNFKIDYPSKIRLERSLFLIARAICLRFLDHELSGFSGNSRRELEHLQRDHGASEACKTVFMAFELAAILQMLTSGDPYWMESLGGPDLIGRKDATKLFIRTVRRFTGRARRLKAI